MKKYQFFFTVTKISIGFYRRRLVKMPKRFGELSARRFVAKVTIGGFVVFFGLRVKSDGDFVPLIDAAPMGIVIYIFRLNVPSWIESLRRKDKVYFFASL